MLTHFHEGYEIHNIPTERCTHCTKRVVGVLSPNGLPRSADQGQRPRARMGGHLGSISNDPLNGLTGGLYGTSYNRLH